MPLPPALAARLQKRGLLQNKPEVKPPQPISLNTPGNEEVEEVFAEDYDEPVKDEPVLPEPAAETRVKPSQEDEEDSLREVPACPNRSNPYHECSDYCKQRWGMKVWNPTEDMIRKRDRMLRKYPLPPEWQEIADPETDRYYYWNTQTDQVSWLSPIHPRAVITLSAEKLQAVLRNDGYTREDSESEDSEEEGMDVSDSESSSSSSSDEDEYDRRHEKGRLAHERASERNRGRVKQQREEIDPMDPASYSDIPRGGWSAGLERSGEAKTGVDSTASGPLFQQRPYPSPGAVLRANRDRK
ncbi:polyglutamine-binding protein 1-like [Mercenaria mercenaria]|uniref:polyglutamine-binding protein 1-like n=1 Tax=Mercenaria mercenaria TaxID=6596 RepID=UPI001E1E082D|nr:polyglutamine-binding protein 1-like [Mercenaria mercenaria]